MRGFALIYFNIEAIAGSSCEAKIAVSSVKVAVFFII
jgi:hypothetical protein